MANRRLWELARRAAPRPRLVEAVEASVERLGADGWTALGVLLRRALRPLDALEAFDRAAGMPGTGTAAPPEVEAGLLLAELRADELALERFGRRPGHPAAMYGTAFVLARSGRRSEALERVEEVLRLDPVQPAARLLRAELLDSLGRGDEAIGGLRVLAGETGPVSPAAFRLGRMLARAGSADEALPILRAVVDRAPAHAEAWLALARAHRERGAVEEAERAFRRALEANPGLNEARFGLGQLLRHAGKQEEAVGLFAEFEQRKAVADESGRLLGEAEMWEDFPRIEAFVEHALSSGEFGLALRGAQRFLVEKPDDPERHLLLARVWREGGSRADAERVLERGRIRFAADGGVVGRFEAALRDVRP